MTIDEAIKHCEEKTKELREQPFKEKMDIEDVAACEECAEEHEQLATWLKELKVLKENKGDLISREALKEALSKRLWFVSSPECDAQEIKEVIDNAPTVEISQEQAIDKLNEIGWLYNHDKAISEFARPQGEWIIIKDERYGDNVKCPFCGKELAGTDLNFCCKCGAKLIGSEKMNGGADMRGKEE